MLPPTLLCRFSPIFEPRFRVVHPVQMIFGCVAVAAAFAAFVYASNNQSQIRMLKRKHPGASIVLVMTGGYIVIYLFGSVLVFLFGIALPMLGMSLTGFLFECSQIYLNFLVETVRFFNARYVTHSVLCSSNLKCSLLNVLETNCL